MTPDPADVARLWPELRSCPKIAEVLGCTPEQARAALNQAGIRPGSGRQPEHRISRGDLSALYESGMSQNEIADRLGWERATLGYWFRKYGLSARGHGSPGAKNPSWRGGRYTDRDGYVLLHCPGHPHTRENGKVLEHRLVMEKHIGRYLDPDEVVHHIDGNRSNNAISNLELYARNSEHLASELAGKCPRWTPEGLRAIQIGARKPRIQVDVDQLRELCRAHRYRKDIAAALGVCDETCQKLIERHEIPWGPMRRRRDRQPPTDRRIPIHPPQGIGVLALPL